VNVIAPTTRPATVRRPDPGAERWQYRLAPALGIPFAYRGISFETVLPTKAVRIAAKAADPEDDTYRMRAAGIEGTVGTSKTTALVCFSRSVSLANGPLDRLTFFTFPALSKALLDPLRRDQTLEACCESDDLVLDDLGSGYTKSAGLVVGLLEEVFVHREGSQYPVLFSTNLKPSAFRALFGDRVYDRLAGPWGSWHDVSGPSFRSKAATTTFTGGA
jgi:DNA replication protein DnaC